MKHTTHVTGTTDGIDSRTDTHDDTWLFFFTLTHDTYTYDTWGTLHSRRYNPQRAVDGVVGRVDNTYAHPQCNLVNLTIATLLRLLQGDGGVWYVNQSSIYLYSRLARNVYTEK